MQKNRFDILVKNTTWVYISKIFVQVLTFVVNVLVIRKLSVEIYGTYNFLLGIMTFVNVLALSSITSVFNRYIPELLEKKDFFTLKKMVRYGIGLGTGIFLIIMVLIYVFQDEFGRLFNVKNFNIYLLTLFVYMFFSFFKAILDNVLKSLLLHKKTSLLTMFTSLLTASLMLYFLPRLNVKLLLYITALGAAIYLFASLTILIRFFPKAKLSGNGYSGIEKKQVMRYGFFSSLNELGAGIIGKTSDNFIVASVGNQYYVGLYSFALKIYKLVFKLLPMKDFLTVLRPLFIGKFSKEFDKKEFDNIYNFIVKIMLNVYAIPFLYFFIFGKYFITFIYGTKYVGALWVLCILLFDNYITAFFYPLGLTIILKERIDIAFYSKIVVVFSIIAGIYGMKYFGIVGVALATVTGNLLRNLFMFFVFKKQVKINYFFKEYLNVLFALVIIIVPFMFAVKFIDGVVTFLILNAIFAVVTLVVLTVLHPYNAMDLVYLEKIVSRSKFLRMVSRFILKIYSFTPNFLKKSI